MHEIKERWVENISDLLNINSETDESVLDELGQLPVKEELDHPITESELEKALNNTKFGKNPGSDGVLPEVLVYGCLLYTSPSPRDLSTSRMPSSA